MILSAPEVEAIEQQAAEEYPAECCGVIVTRDAERRLLRFKNLQDEYHQRDPVRFPRTSRTAYRVGVDDLRRLDEAQRDGFAVAVVYHSHIDVGAYFSETDKREAMLGLDPLVHDPMFPEAVYVVVSVVQGQVEAVNGFRWDARIRDFAPVDLRLAREVRR